MLLWWLEEFGNLYNEVGVVDDVHGLQLDHNNSVCMVVEGVLLKLQADDSASPAPAEKQVSDGETWASPKSEILDQTITSEEGHDTSMVHTTPSSSPDALIQRPRSPSRRTAAVLARKRIFEK